MKTMISEKIDEISSDFVVADDDESVSINTLLLALHGRDDSNEISADLFSQLYQLEKSGIYSPFTLGSLEFVEMTETAEVVEVGLKIIISIVLNAGPERDYERAIRETGILVDESAASEIALSLFACEHIIAMLYRYCPVAF